MLAADLPRAFEQLPAAWKAVLPRWQGEAAQRVTAAVARVSDQRPIAPEDPFRALRLVAPGEVKVVIFGQDPYPTPGHADGLAFSAGQGKPASLRRIFAVLAQDRPDFMPPPQWRLDDWAQQGVLLLNPTLTVEQGVIGSHLDCGWQDLTGDIVQVLLSRSDPPAFLLWGSKAQQFFDAARQGGLHKGPRAVVLRTRHPSNDFKRQFMAEGSHFLATADRVDWWRLGRSLFGEP